MLTHREKHIIKIAALRMYGIDMDVLVADTYNRRMMIKTAGGYDLNLDYTNVPNISVPKDIDISKSRRKYNKNIRSKSDIKKTDKSKTWDNIITTLAAIELLGGVWEAYAHRNQIYKYIKNLKSKF